MIVPIVLCGGAGVRLWPASTPAHPKPFIPLVGESSLFQQTVLRVAAIAGAAAPVVVLGAAHLGAAQAQLKQIAVHATLIVEPDGRDSAPALIAAAMWIAKNDPSAIAVAVASDHHIPDGGAFRASAVAAAAAAAMGEIVTFGVKPDGPATVYGYIQPGKALEGAPGIRRIARFVEKPDAARAAAMIAAGALWNSGNFVFRVDAFLAETAQHAPLIVEAVGAAVARARVRGEAVFLGPAFASAPKLSIDVAMIEKTARAAVLAIDHVWSDLGSWRAVWDASAKDQAGNAFIGEARAWKSDNCLLRAGAGVQVLAVGLSNIAVIVEDGRVLVCALDASGELKAALDRG